MAWRRPGDKSLSEPMLVRSLTNICVTQPQWVNPLSSKDPIWWHKYESSLAQVIACLHITWTNVDSRLLASIPVQFHWKYARIPTKGIIQNQSFSDLYASPRGQLVKYIFDCEMDKICWHRHTLCVWLLLSFEKGLLSVTSNFKHKNVTNNYLTVHIPSYLGFEAHFTCMYNIILVSKHTCHIQGKSH